MSNVIVPTRPTPGVEATHRRSGSRSEWGCSRPRVGVAAVGGDGFVTAVSNGNATVSVPAPIR
jgi:hypothetical protein